MTFTHQNFTRLPFLNIRQPVLSLGPICHLSWAPALAKKLADGNGTLLRKKELFFTERVILAVQKVLTGKVIYLFVFLRML